MIERRGLQNRTPGSALGMRRQAHVCIPGRTEIPNAKACTQTHACQSHCDNRTDTFQKRTPAIGKSQRDLHLIQGPEDGRSNWTWLEAAEVM